MPWHHVIKSWTSSSSSLQFQRELGTHWSLHQGVLQTMMMKPHHCVEADIDMLGREDNSWIQTVSHGIAALIFEGCQHDSHLQSHVAVLLCQGLSVLIIHTADTQSLPVVCMYVCKSQQSLAVATVAPAGCMLRQMAMTMTSDVAVMML